jgi:hypothetical protein
MKNREVVARRQGNGLVSLSGGEGHHLQRGPIPQLWAGPSFFGHPGYGRTLAVRFLAAKVVLAHTRCSVPMTRKGVHLSQPE